MRKQNRVKRLHRKFKSGMIGFGFPGDDHVTYATEKSDDDEYPVVISQPYHIGIDDLEQMVAFARENDLVFWITGQSDYCPNYTCKVTWAAKETLPWAKEKTPA